MGEEIHYYNLTFSGKKEEERECVCDYVCMCVCERERG